MELDKEQREVLIGKLLRTQKDLIGITRHIIENKTPTNEFKRFMQVELFLLNKDIELIRQTLINNEL